MTIRDELMALKNTEGMIVAEDAVEWARANPASALHGSIEWDDRKAAHEHRLWQVRRLIAVNLVYESGERQVVSLSIDRTRDGGGYRDVGDILPVKPLRDIMLEDAFKELNRIREKYEKLEELAGVWAAAKDAQTTVKKQRRRGIEQHAVA